MTRQGRCMSKVWFLARAGIFLLHNHDQFGSGGWPSLLYSGYPGVNQQLYGLISHLHLRAVPLLIKLWCMSILASHIHFRSLKGSPASYFLLSQILFSPSIRIMYAYTVNLWIIQCNFHTGFIIIVGTLRGKINSTGHSNRIQGTKVSKYYSYR
jgi:hypothetical protein